MIISSKKLSKDRYSKFNKMNYDKLKELIKTSPDITEECFECLERECKYCDK